MPHAAEVGLGEGERGCGRAVADRLPDLLRLGASGRFDNGRRDVVALDDVARGEERHPFGVVAEHAHVAQRPGIGWQLGQHALEGGIMALHEADLHDPAGAIAGLDDPVGVGERDAERLLDEHVQPGVEGCEHGGGVGRVRRGDQYGVEAACIQQIPVTLVHARNPVARGERLADHPARVGKGRQLEPVPQLGEVGEVHRLGDHPAAHDADPDAAVLAHPVPAPARCDRSAF